MKFTWRQLLIATLVVSPVLLSGCGGFAASDTVSPASIFLPGAQVKPLRTSPTDPSPVATSGQEVLVSSCK